MSKVQAWEKLQDTSYSGTLNMVDFKKLLIKAGYNPKVAHKAALKRGWDRLEAGVNL